MSKTNTLDELTNIAIVDAGYHMIQCYMKALNEVDAEMDAHPPIVRAIDRATGNYKAKRLDILNSIVTCFNDLIEAKGQLGVNTLGDEEALSVAKQMIDKEG